MKRIIVTFDEHNSTSFTFEGGINTTNLLSAAHYLELRADCDIIEQMRKNREEQDVKQESD